MRPIYPRYGTMAKSSRKPPLGAWGYRVNASLALGMLHRDLTKQGTEIEVEIYGERRKAIV